MYNLGLQKLQVLMVAEKPSVAKSITDALCDTQYKNYKIGGQKGVPVFEYDGTIFNLPAHFKVTSCVGHLFGIDFPSEYSNWKSTDARTLFEAPLRRIPAQGGDKLNHSLASLSSWT